jgi:hypothetical protein
MGSVKLWCSRMGLVLGGAGLAWMVNACLPFNAQLPLLAQSSVDRAGVVQSKQALAKAVLLEIGTAQQYDQFFWHSVDIAVVKPRPVFAEWLQQLFAKRAGWAYAEDEYVAQLTANFSEAELQELLTLAKRPLIKKLLRAEMQAYQDASPERRQLLYEIWDDYNSGKVDVPPEVLR